MEESIMCLIKYTEHKNITQIFKKPTLKPKKAASDHTGEVPRIVRVPIVDHDATDSSSDEEADFFGLQRVKRYVNEINVEVAAVASTVCNGSHKRTIVAANDATGSCRPIKVSLVNRNGRKFKVVRQRLWGKWAVEIRDPARRVWLWLGTYDTTEEATMVYDNAVIKLRGLDDLTNSVTPPAKEDNNGKPENLNASSVSGYESSDESTHNLSSPTSILNFRIQSSEKTPPSGSLENYCLSNSHTLIC